MQGYTDAHNLTPQFGPVLEPQLGLETNFRKFGRFIAELLLAIILLGAASFIYQSTAFQEQLFKVESAFNGGSVQTPPDAGVKAVAAISKVSPAVVSIYGYQNTPAAAGFVVYTKVTAGTGFFVSSDGYILTNKHVVAGDDFTYYVILSSGKKVKAKVVYRDPLKDAALIKISGQDYQVANVGDSSKVKIGQTVLGVGNDYGKDLKVSQGAVSGLHKSLLADGEVPQRLSNVIQTTAQLYPGDSGGPLFDLDGNVIGINVATAESAANMSFSIPINDVKNIIQMAGQQA